MWPVPCAFHARTPDGVGITVDGRVALLRLDIDSAKNTFDVYMPPIENDLIPEGRAKALLIAGTREAPDVIINDKLYEGKTGSITVNGESYLVVPLFGETLEAAMNGLAARFAEARQRLE